MAKSDCSWCRKRPVQDAAICSTCMGQASTALGNVPALEVELDLAITRQTRYGAVAEGGPSAETPVAFNVPAAHIAHALRNVLVTWSRVYAEEARANLPADTLTSMSRFLLPRCEWFRHHDAGCQFLGDVTGAVADAMKVIDTPENRTTFKVGPCPELPEDDHCPGEVRAYFPSDDTRPRLECGACGAIWYGEQWLRAGKRILARREELHERIGA